MTVTAADSVPKREGLSWLWHRELDAYPETGPRLTYLAITVIATIMLYYELYVGGSVSTLFLVKLHMSFTFFVYTLAVGAVIGAFGSLFAGLTDRLGRTNIVVDRAWGSRPSSPPSSFRRRRTSGSSPSSASSSASSRASAWSPPRRSSGTSRPRSGGPPPWASGPAARCSAAWSSSWSPATSSTETPARIFWVTLYRICGIAGLVVFALALVGLRELSPGLRDQLMVSMQDRALIEARAKGLDIEASLRNPFGQLIKPDIVVSALGISLFLLIYYTAVGFALIYFTTVFTFTVHQGDALGNWNWGFNVIAVILFGFISDKLRVRKPLMILGGVAAAIMIVLYLNQIGKPTSYYHMAVLLAALAFALGVAYVPWMASFTETVEARNPALTATGLAIWGWIIRMVVFASYLILPAVVNTVTPLVTYGSTVAAANAKYASEVAFLQTPAGQQAVALAPELNAIATHPLPFAALAANPNSAALQAAAARAVGPAMFASIASHQAAITTLLTQHTADLAKLAAAQRDPNFQVLIKHGASVVHAAKTTGGQWKTWYWICFGGVIFFLLTVPLMKGRWSPQSGPGGRRSPRGHGPGGAGEAGRRHRLKQPWPAPQQRRGAKL